MKRNSILLVAWSARARCLRVRRGARRSAIRSSRSIGIFSVNDALDRA
jgi:hypothetical protein